MKSLRILLLIFIVFSYPVFSCTGVYIARGDTILAGNNEDWTDPDTRIWFEPGKKGKYGAVYFGFDNFYPQGGMNEAGLFFDGFATSRFPVNKSADKPRFYGNLTSLALRECSTVEEVIEQFYQWDLTDMERAMLMFGDAFGNSVIIEGDEYILKTGEYQVTTNFYQSVTDSANISCRRYKKAMEMLGQPFPATVEFLRDVMDSVHQEFTQYTNVYDLKNKVVYLWHFHDYKNVVKIDLKEELAKGKHSYNLPDLFPRNEEFYNRFIRKKTPSNSNFVKLILGVSGIFYLLTLILLPRGIKNLRGDIVSMRTIIAALICSAFHLIYLLAIAAFPEVPDIGLPQSFAGIPFWQVGLIFIPFVLIFVTIYLLWHFIKIFKKESWPDKYRNHILLVVISSIILIGFYAYWGLIAPFNFL